MSDTEKLKPRLKEYVETITTKGRGNYYICPICHSGQGRSKTPAFSIYENDTKWKCFSGNCTEEGNRGGDIFDLIGAVENITEFSEKVQRLSKIFGIERTPYKKEQSAKPVATQVEEQKEKPLNDQSANYQRWNKDLNKTTYHRGISLETLNRFKVGYCEDWVNPLRPNTPPSKRLLIPHDSTHYFARSTEDGKQYEKLNIGAKPFPLFNGEALKTNEKPIFIVEGALDALSIIEAGGQAVGLGGVTGSDKLIQEVKALQLSGSLTTRPFIIALDSDKAGVKDTEKLYNGLQNLGLNVIIGRPNGFYNDKEDGRKKEYKDPNEALMKEGLEFLENGVSLCESQALEESARDFEQKKAEYLNTSVANNMASFYREIRENRNKPYISSGFGALDKELGGGLFNGLYVLGAVSSMGKTTYAMQMADHIASNGIDVLIFSLEMSRSDLIAKSLSRHSFLHCKDKGLGTMYAKSSNGILRGYYKNEEQEILKEAGEAYAKYNEHLYIHEGMGKVDTALIRNTIRNHIYFTGNTPVIFVDFLQILKNPNDRLTGKDRVDANLVELKAMVQEFNTPIIVISSFNRQSYRRDVDMDSFKESGDIEYITDVLLGLQPQGVAEAMNIKTGKTDLDIKEVKRNPLRPMELQILKNRKGRTNGVIKYDYYAVFNYYEEKDEEATI